MPRFTLSADPLTIKAPWMGNETYAYSAGSGVVKDISEI